MTSWNVTINTKISNTINSKGPSVGKGAGYIHLVGCDTKNLRF